MSNMKIISFILCVLVLASFVVAERYIIQQARYGEIDENGNLVTTATPISDYNAIGYVCANRDCSSVASRLWNGNVINSGYMGHSDWMLVRYPTELQSRYGYGVYFYKPGYITWEVSADWWGTSSDDPQGPINLYLTKQRGCHAPIDNFEITNEVQPNVPLVMGVEASIDATTYSALHHHGPLDYVPPSLMEDYYSLRTKITLEIYNSDDVLVFSQSKEVLIPFSGSVRVDFTWTPQESCSHYAVVYTDVIDEKCVCQVRQSADKYFKVLSDEPNGECYAILNNLATDNQFPRVGDNIEITYSKISNYAYDDFSLTPVPTNVMIDIIRSGDGEVMFEDVLSLPANANAKDPTYFRFFWDTAGYQEGWYTIIVSGIAESDLCDEVPNVLDQAAMEVYLSAPVTHAPVFDELPDLTIPMNSGANNRFIDLWEYTTDLDTPLEDMDYYIVGQSNPSLINCWIEDGHFVTCDAPAHNQHGTSFVTIEANDDENFDADSFLVTVERIPQGPIISNIPNVQFVEGSCVSVDLDNYVADPDNSVSELEWSVHNNLNVIISINHETHIAEYCAYGWTGQEEVAFKVEDPDGLFDTDNVLVTVLPRNTAPIIDGLPNRVFCQGSGVQSKIIDLWAYTNDRETPNNGLVFTIVSQTETGVAYCVIEESRYLTCTVNHIGQTDITIRVIDGELSDTDTTRIIVESCIPPNTPPEFQADIPNKTLCRDSGENHRIIDLWSYAHDAETSDSGLSFFIFSESNTTIADCYIEEDRYVSCNAGSFLGESKIQIKVSDGDFSDIEDFDIVVENCAPANTAPIIEGLPDLSYCLPQMPHGGFIDLWAYTHDSETPDSELTFTVESQSNTDSVECSISLNRYVSCTPKAAGYSDVAIRVSDGELSDTDTFRANVSICHPTNTPPVLDSALPDKDLCSDTGLNQNIIDLWSYAYDAETSDSGLSFFIFSESNTTIADCYIEEDRYVSCFVGLAIGSSRVNVKVSDGELSDTEDFNINVVNCVPENTPPVLEGIPDKRFCSNDNLKSKIIDLWAYAYDAETQDSELLFSIISETNTGAADCFIESNRHLSCLIGGAVGYSDITIKVSDGSVLSSLSDTDVMRVYSDQCIPTNTHPRLSELLPDATICYGSGLNQIIDLWAYAEDSETSDSDLSFSIVSESNANVADCFVDSGRYISCSADSLGYNNIMVSVSDGHLFDTEDFRVDVVDCSQGNNPPSIMVVEPICNAVVDGLVEIKWVATDEDDEPLLITIEYSPNNGYQWYILASDIPNTGSYLWDTRFVPDQATYLIRVTAYDGHSSVRDITDCAFTVNNNKASLQEELKNKKYEVTVLGIDLANSDYLKPDDTLWIGLTIENTGDYNLKGLRASFTILDLGLQRTIGPFDLKKGADIYKRTFIDLEGARPGIYDLKVEIWNEHVKRVIYRPITVVS
ncbi:MAG: hypothetical protein QXK37_03650 [Candidatus Woesearchaeota archaeon]